MQKAFDTWNILLNISRTSLIFNMCNSGKGGWLDEGHK